MEVSEDINEYIYKGLGKLVLERYAAKKPYSAQAFENAIATLKRRFANEAIISAKGDRINGEKIPGVGKGVTEEIAKLMAHKGVEMIEVPTVDISTGPKSKHKKKKSVTFREAPFQKEKLLLAQSVGKTSPEEILPPGFNPVGMYMSEKWDGYRAVWDGENFYSRNTSVYHSPEYFRKLMPKNIMLDGELWIGRGKFEQSGLFRHKYADPKQWKAANVKYKVFDIPSLKKPFEARMKELQDLVKKTCHNIPRGALGPSGCPLEYTKQIKVTSRQQVEKFFREILDMGGEGVMLRKPASMYEWKRSGTLLKVKPVLDSECVITGYTKGTGKYKDYLGAFKCQWTHDGEKVNFKVSGMTDQIRRDYEKTHPVGTVLTIRYNELTELGAPRHPRYIRKRGHVSGLRHLTIKDFPPRGNKVWSSYDNVFRYMKQRFNAPKPPHLASKNEKVLCQYLEKVMIGDIETPVSLTLPRSKSKKK